MAVVEEKTSNRFEHGDTDSASDPEPLVAVPMEMTDTSCQPRGCPHSTNCISITRRRLCTPSVRNADERASSRFIRPLGAFLGASPLGSFNLRTDPHKNSQGESHWVPLRNAWDAPTLILGGCHCLGVPTY